MKTRFFCMTFLLAGLVAFSQTNRSLYLETGPSVYMPLQHQEHVVINNTGGYYGADYILTNKTMAGINLNIGFEQRVAGKGTLFLSLPFAFGYRNQIEKMERNGYYYGDFVAFKGIEHIEYNTQLAGLSVGAKLNYGSRKTSCFLGAVFHNELAFKQTQYYHSIPENGLSDYRSVNSSDGNTDDFRINLSLQAGFMYRVEQNWSLGLSLDCYMYNLTEGINRLSNYNGIFNLSNTGKVSAAVFNPAIRVSRHF